ALPRADDGEDACAAPVREARGIGPGGGRGQRDETGPDRVGRLPSTVQAGSLREARAEAERVVAWLRLPAIALIALSEGLAHPNDERRAFFVALIAYSAWSLGILVWVHVRPVSERLALAATGVDIVAITVLVALSGGAFSHARLAYFLIPVAVAFRFRPSVT